MLMSVLITMVDVNTPVKTLLVVFTALVMMGMLWIQMKKIVQVCMYIVSINSVGEKLAN